MKDEYCDQHSEHRSRIKIAEKGIHDLWDKWDSIQKLLIITLTTMCLNLVGIIAVAIKIF